MKTSLLIAFGLALTTLPAAAQHPCAADARARGVSLLALHVESSPTELSNSISDEVTELKPIKALKGKGRFDVLEVEGFVYKATYRMRFIYAQGAGNCLLMGQEIIEVADPY